MKSRYDKNQELYAKVKNNDYDDYNNGIEDFNIEFEAKESRKKFQEKKRLSIYFKDIEQELESANEKFSNISNSRGLEIKKDADLKTLIEQAKKNHRENGGNIFSNTQYEILSSLNVEESDVEEDSNLMLEEIIGQTMELDLENQLISDDFSDSIVQLNDISDYIENDDEVDDDEDEEDDDYDDCLKPEYDNVKDIKTKDKNNLDDNNNDIYNKNDKMLTILLVLMIIALVLVVIVIGTQYVGDLI
ncbi:MAG: hypothetical protein ACK5NF_03755 [Bacilli bacterium]